MHKLIHTLANGLDGVFAGTRLFNLVALRSFLARESQTFVTCESLKRLFWHFLSSVRDSQETQRSRHSRLFLGVRAQHTSQNVTD